MKGNYSQGKSLEQLLQKQHLNMISLVKTNRQAKLPVRGTPGSAGFDIAALQGGSIPPLSLKLFRTGLRFKHMQPGIFAQLTSRSGLGLHKKCITLLGTIDSDFRGEIKVVLYNTSPTEEIKIEPGERISQMIFHYAISPNILANAQPITSQRLGGFGSTGSQNVSSVGDKVEPTSSSTITSSLISNSTEDSESDTSRSRSPLSSEDFGRKQQNVNNIGRSCWGRENDIIDSITGARIANFYEPHTV
jgi:dUTP pyrophosphatase